MRTLNYLPHRWEMSSKGFTRRGIVLATFLILWNATRLGAAEEQTLRVTPTAAVKPWKDVGEFSVVSANGNSKATTTAAKNTFSYQWSRSLLELLAGGLGSSNGSAVTAEQYNTSEKVTWTLEGRNYLFERGAWDKNRFAGIANRYDVSTGLGRVLLNFPKEVVMTELGGGYINEERTEAPRNDFVA